MSSNSSPNALLQENFAKSKFAFYLIYILYVAGDTVIHLLCSTDEHYFTDTDNTNNLIYSIFQTV